MEQQGLDFIPIKLGEITWKRPHGREPQINLINRFFEENPTNQVDQVALLTRPALMHRTNVGSGPIRAVYQEDGCFGGDAFVVSGEDLFRIRKNRAAPDDVTAIPGVIHGDGTPSLVATDDDYLFVADGYVLQLYDGVAPALQLLDTPDDTPVINLAYVAHYVICVMNNSQQFYWIKPGETTIDPLNFAQAEMMPDLIVQAMSLNDQFALFGTKTSEFWYPTGELAAPFMRAQGRMYERGIWEGTAVKVADSIIVVGTDGSVYELTGGGPQRVSYYAMEEQIRKAMKTQVLEG